MTRRKHTRTSGQPALKPAGSSVCLPWLQALLLFSLGLGLLQCSEQRELVLRDFSLHSRPSQTVRELEQQFSYPEAALLLSGVYRSDRVVSAPEGFLVADTEDSLKTVRERYVRAVESMGWNIIQSLDRGGEALLMVESPAVRYRRLVTIVLRRAETRTKIKLYFRRSNN